MPGGIRLRGGVCDDYRSSRNNSRFNICVKAIQVKNKMYIVSKRAAYAANEPARGPVEVLPRWLHLLTPLLPSVEASQLRLTSKRASMERLTYVRCTPTVV